MRHRGRAQARQWPRGWETEAEGEHERKKERGRERKKEGCGWVDSVRVRIRFTKIIIMPLKLQPKEKKNVSCIGPISIYRLKQPNFAGMAGIFSYSKQGVYLYRCIGQYVIYLWYKITHTERKWHGISFKENIDWSFFYASLCKFWIWIIVVVGWEEVWVLNLDNYFIMGFRENFEFS